MKRLQRRSSLDICISSSRPSKAKEKLKQKPKQKKRQKNVVCLRHSRVALVHNAAAKSYKLKPVAPFAPSLPFNPLCVETEPVFTSSTISN